MGYTTEFKGELKFTTELTASQLAYLKTMLGEDCRDHPEWQAPGLYCIDLELNDEFSGIRWDGTEKTYDMDQLVNVVAREMRKKYPTFSLTGKLFAQGEDAEDQWWLVIDADGLAKKVPIQITGAIVTCPECEHRFIVDNAGEAMKQETKP